ncbi:MAG TPA: hypothetical protein VKT82_05750 [Ktedonobacterales bacterium]|nr:hypothetical protein [Ktedonobacterales bacterium]
MPGWEYLFVNACQLPGPGGGEWHPHLVNNQSLPNWERGPTLDSFIQQLEAKGWRLAGKQPYSPSSQAITITLMFKRPRGAQNAPPSSESESEAAGA